LLLLDTSAHEAACARYVRIEGREHLAAYLSSNRAGWFRVAYVPDVGRDDEIEIISRWAYALGDCCLVIDELDLHVRPNVMPPDFKRLVVQGRHRSVDMIGVAREPQQIPVAFRSQVTDFYCFRYFDPRALDWFRQAGCLGAERLPELKGHSYLHWQDGVLEES